MEVITQDLDEVRAKLLRRRTQVNPKIVCSNIEYNPKFKIILPKFSPTSLNDNDYLIITIDDLIRRTKEYEDFKTKVTLAIHKSVCLANEKVKDFIDDCEKEWPPNIINEGKFCDIISLKVTKKTKLTDDSIDKSIQLGGVYIPKTLIFDKMIIANQVCFIKTYVGEMTKNNKLE